MLISTDTTLRSLPLSEDLLLYYRDKLDQCQQHYEDAINQIAILKLPHEDVHKTAWESHKRAREITELQTALSDAQLAVFEERKEVLRLKAENDEMRVQELRDRKKINYLLSIGGVTEEETTYFRDKLNKRLVRSPSAERGFAHHTENENQRRDASNRTTMGSKQTSSASLLEANSRKSYSRPALSRPQTTSSQQPGRADTKPFVLATTASSTQLSTSEATKTINLLNTTLQTTQLRLVALQTQLEEQRVHYESIIDHLMKDRKARMEEERVRHEHEAERIGNLMDKVHRMRALCRENTRELLHTKKTALANEKNLIEQKTQMSIQLSEIQKELSSEKSRQEQAEQTIETRITKRQESLISELRLQINKSEEEMKKLKVTRSGFVEGATIRIPSIHDPQGALATANQSNKKTVDHLKSRLSATASSYQSLKRRRDYEIEGFTNDILMLRKQLKTLEKTILKINPLEDKELLLLNLARETGERVAKISTGLHGLKAKVHATEDEIRSIAF
ncbi:Coiled-coil domain-containing protein 77 [Rhizophlyctis rosea]|uniref:Coiled-coil domain-containing protein 77 n=1 Tax=Rhizophlyctis rosea TaxID=64517 RepID=A0AAD5SLM4_9FUNG|nr:Coiled-coil domain-containing protein 77 [Rhizophlyctis rosea]